MKNKIVGFFALLLLLSSCKSNSQQVVPEVAKDVFTVDFVATKDGSIAEMIDVTSKVTTAEAYVGQSLEIRGVTISTRGDVVSADNNELFQNEPNPFRELTNISFELAEAGAVQFTVTDVTGRVVMNINTAGIKGMNIVPISADDLGANGVYYYTVKSGAFIATKNMIVVR